MDRRGSHANLALSKPNAKVAIKPGVLDSKTKELMALAVGIAARRDGRFGFHTEAASTYGAAREQTDKTIGVV